jgi:thermostable 8-oxoguanine DNA glycosylase
LTTSDSKKLAKYVCALPDFVFYEIMDGDYNHMGAIVADAVLQANNRYATNVKPRVNSILKTYPEVRTTSELLSLLETIRATEFLNWRDKDRTECFMRVVNLFASEHIETEENLKNWLIDDKNLTKLRSIKGIGPKTVDYFKILVGLKTSAIERHLLAFIKLAGLRSSSYYEAQAIIDATADILSVKRAYFDHSIWRFMSKRAAQHVIA